MTAGKLIYGGTSRMIYTKENYDLSKIGGKASALAKLACTSCNIPEWFAVSTEGAATPAIALALQSFNDDALFAVRSSATDEDGRSHSFAGQFETYLNIPKEKVYEHILKVQASATSSRVKVYLQEHSLESVSTPAVLVQQMVKADLAGVAFGANPVTGNTKECIISAVPGLGDKLVDGSVNAETYTVRGDTVQGSGILTAAQCEEIAALCNKVSRFFGRIQDIEWAYEKGKLFLLQSRPVTTLRKWTGRVGNINIWDNSNIAESYNGVTTPLTFSFIRLAYEHVYREMCRMLGVSEKKIIENDFIFTHMLGMHAGQVYYNLLSWYKLVAILPGYKTNAKFMEQMMGVREELPEEVRCLLPPPSDSSLFSAARKLFRHYRRNEKNIAQFMVLLNNTIGSKDLSGLTLSELASYFRNLESKLLKNWDAPVINDFFSMIFYGLLKNATAKWCGLDDESKFNGLLRDTGDIISAEPARRVREMAEIASSDEALTKLLISGNVYEIESALPDSIMGKASAYLTKFGDRCINELKLESETLNDNPLPFYRAVGNFALKIRAGNQAEAQDNFDEAAVIKSSGLKKPAFKWLLNNARRTIRNRENLRFERTRVFGTARSIFKEIGMRLTSFGVLDSYADIFYLEYGEILAYIEGTATTLNLRGLVELRKKEYASFDGSAPDRFKTYDCAALSERHCDKTTMPQADTGDILKGLGCCPGIVRGRARVITNPKGAVIHPGEILVAQRTDPGWIMLFPVATGVLVEYGSLLSHAAIVVREMGIPAVVSVEGLLAQIKTGDLLELDGEKGLVKKLAERD